MKTPPAKQEEKLINIRILLVTSGLCLNWENSFSGIIPNRKVMTVIASKVITYIGGKIMISFLIIIITFSVTMLTPRGPTDLCSTLSTSFAMDVSLTVLFKASSMIIAVLIFSSYLLCH